MKKYILNIKKSETFKGLGFLFQSIIALFLATLCTIFLKFIGIIYGFGWICYFLFYKGDVKSVLKYVDTYIGGTLQNVSWLLMNFNLFQDYMWNLGGSGEFMEDYSTSKEESLFNQPMISISAAIGHSELTKDITPHSIKFSKILNKLFREANHCLSAYRKYLVDKAFNIKEFGTDNRIL